MFVISLIVFQKLASTRSSRTSLPSAATAQTAQLNHTTNTAVDQRVRPEQDLSASIAIEKPSLVSDLSAQPRTASKKDGAMLNPPVAREPNLLAVAKVQAEEDNNSRGKRKLDAKPDEFIGSDSTKKLKKQSILSGRQAQPSVIDLTDEAVKQKKKASQHRVDSAPTQTAEAGDINSVAKVAANLVVLTNLEALSKVEKVEDKIAWVAKIVQNLEVSVADSIKIYCNCFQFS